jgi:hypothetical protein
MYLTGDVTATGDVAIDMHGERTDDSRSISPEPFKMVRVNAKGSFRGGRA